MFYRLSPFFDIPLLEMKLREKVGRDSRANTIRLNETNPLKTVDKRFGLHMELHLRDYEDILFQFLKRKSYFTTHPKYLISGTRFMFHDSYELPFKSSQVIYAPYWNISYFMVTPVVTMIDDSLIGFTPEE